MLILPLHRPITRANFPLATAALVVLNLFVFVFLQSRDERAAEHAAAYYQSSGLTRIEAPLYITHRQQATEQLFTDAELAELPAEMQSQLLQQAPMHDTAFRERLDRGELFADRQAFAAWQPLAAEFARLRAAIFTNNHALHADAPSLSGMLSSMFLHAGFDHLLGNMLFLIALGLLVEAPLGHGRFLLLYLLGGVGAAAVWLAFAERGSVIGASGAIAALMGAFCVLWGQRKVRFFYWFFIVFDYVKGPALALLPVWLGWELLQWALRDGSNVAFEAHAGGIVSGVLLAVIAKRLGWERSEAYDESSAPRAGDDTRELARIRELMGRLQLDEARPALDRLLQAQPGRFELQQLGYRMAQLSGRKQEADQLGRALLSNVASGPVQVDEQLRVFEELRRGGDVEIARLGWQLVGRMLARGTVAKSLLDTLLADPAAMQALPLAQLLGWALRLHEQGAGEQAVRLLRALIAAQPDSTEAGKAGFLLSEWQQSLPS